VAEARNHPRGDAGDGGGDYSEALVDPRTFGAGSRSLMMDFDAPSREIVGVHTLFCLAALTLIEAASNHSRGLALIGTVLLCMGIVVAFQWKRAKQRDASAKNAKNNSNPTH
jgi:hypothetical protein